MKNKKRFTFGVLASIAIYISAITATANTTKSIGLKHNLQETTKVVAPEKENKKPNTEVVKEENTTNKSNPLVQEKENKVTQGQNTTAQPQQINPQGSTENIAKNSNTATNEPIKKEVVSKYINKGKVSIYNDPQGSKIIDTLTKSTRVEILKEESVENKKESKIKKADGTYEIKITAQINEWAKIKYTKDLKTKEGWVKCEYLTKDIHKVIPENLSKIDFSPVNKISYPNNPKRNDIKGIYLTVYSAALDKKLDELIALTKKTGINAFVIDVKDDAGQMLFETNAEKKYLGTSKKRYPIADIQKLMKKLKDNNIYTIARIVSFKDPRYAQVNPDKAIIKRADGKPFTNSDGVIWVSAHDRNLWEYNVAVAKEAALAGFNEIQFDYVRFPASNGGKLDKELNYRNINGETKPETIQNYLKYARKELEPYQVYISADVYGQVGSSYDDMALGQQWEVVSNEVDFICPMAYPSHYGKGVYGLDVPDAHPYKTIYHSTLDGLNRNNNIQTPANVRPWLQAFTAKWVKGYIPYGHKEIQQQVKALKDLGINEYLLWSPSNKYGMVEK